MSASSQNLARLCLPLVTLLAAGLPGCSSTSADEGFVAPPAGGLPGYDDEGGSDSGGGDEPWDDGTGGSDGGWDDGDAPAEPDGEGVDNDHAPPPQCDVESDVTLYLSPDDSNSMSSPVQVREAVLSGWGSVQAVAIRTWEFFNYYSFDYPAAEAGQVRITPSLAAAPGELEGEYLLQIGISSEAVTPQDRAPINVTLVLDTSGSMNGQPMSMLKETSRAIAASLKEGDVVSMVTWSTEDAVVLGGYHVSGPSDPLLLEKIDGLSPGGGTDLHGGLTAGYALAEDVYDPARINRIVLISDGGANAGITDVDIIAAHAGGHDEDGIYMVGVGVGDVSSYHDDLMDTVTDAGKGASVFIADEDEAWAVFHDQFISTLAVAARDVQVRLELPPGFELVRYSAEEVSDDPSEVEPQHLAPNDAMVFFQQLRTCAPELLASDAELTIFVRYRDGVTFEEREAQRTMRFDELLQADPGRLLKGAAIFTYAESLKAYKRGDGEQRQATVDDALAALQRAEQALPGDQALMEIRAVLEGL